MQYKLIASALASFAIGSAVAGPIEARGEQAKSGAQCLPSCGFQVPGRDYDSYNLHGQEWYPNQHGYNFDYANQHQYYKSSSSGHADAHESTGIIDGFRYGDQCHPFCGSPVPGRTYHSYNLGGEEWQPHEAGYNFNYANSKAYYSSSSSGHASGQESSGWIKARAVQAKASAQCYGESCGYPQDDRNYQPYYLDNEYITPTEKGYNFDYANEENLYSSKNSASGSGYSISGGPDDSEW
ncbi:Hypothetical predicted protein [Lecanosticta acicola]|uniref:Uncharacterized protein n=1 Tax=Lecanosticta acicola TaxID=111012 RepID=A0AAI8Z9K2_9PEZI|nr:Hypothetical predicted protein [Lecanosticta acicola]